MTTHQPRLAKSNHVVLAEGAANMRRFGAPARIADRLDALAKLSKERPKEYHRVGQAVLAGLLTEAELS